MIITSGINEEIQFLKDLINHISDKDFEGTYINLNGKVVRVDITNREEVLVKIKRRLNKLEK